MEYLAKMIRDAIEELGDDDVSLRESYSGRSMYGRSCPGITGSMSGCMQIIGTVIKAAHFEHSNDEVIFEEVVDMLLDFCQDSMGRDVILYWPQLEAFEELPCTELQDAYDGGTCPDCGEGIPDSALPGHGCSNCGYVFTLPVAAE
jgi:hypothetical protein